MNTDTILIAFVAVAGVALLLQAIILLAIFLTAKKALEKLRQDFEDLRDAAMPVFNMARDTFTRVGPKIEPVADDVLKTAGSVRTISSDLADITAKLRVQVAEVQTSAAEVTERMKQQAARLDGILTRVLDVADRAGDILQQTVAVPVRQLAGILAAAKAILESLRAYEPAAQRNPAANDDESFI